MKVNYKDNKVCIDGELFNCPRGTKFFSISTWCNLFGKGWSRQRTRTFLRLLESDQKINLQGLRKTTKLSVCNYNTYQNSQPTDNPQTNQQPTNSQPQLKERIKKENTIYPFSDFWDDYNYKKERKPCEAYYKKISAEDRLKIKAHIPLYNNSKEVKSGYKVYPIRYLKREKWNDEVELPERNETENVPFVYSIEDHLIAIDEYDYKGYLAWCSKKGTKVRLNEDKSLKTA